jgi:hypothetical protein
MLRNTNLKSVFAVAIPAIALIVFTDAHLRKMERFEELVAKGQGINSPLADFLHRRFGSTLAIKQIREDLEFEIEPQRRLRLWADLVEAHRSQNDADGVIEACSSWIEEYPNDPRTLRAYEEVIVQCAKQQDTKGVKEFLQKWEDALIAMGPEAKLSEMLKWWEFALLNPRVTDETPILERIAKEYPRHVPSLGTLKSLMSVYSSKGKTQDVAALQGMIKQLEDRASPLQLNQSEQQVAEFLLNQRMWSHLQERMAIICSQFSNSINFEALSKKMLSQSGAELGPARQLEFYRQAVDQSISRVRPELQNDNIPLSTLAGDFGMLLWNQGRIDEALKISQLLRKVGPTSPVAYQLERLLWLRNHTTSIRLPHAALRPVTVAPQIDGLQSDMCWFGEEHFVGELKPVAGAEPHETKCWATYDQENLYLFAKCQEPNVDRLSGGTPQPSVWMTDCVEVFFNPAKDYSTYFQLVANAQDKTATLRFNIRDLNVKSASLEPEVWESTAETAMNISPNSWAVEMKIPWKNLGFKPEPGEAIFFNARRFRYAGGRQSIYSWGPTKSSSHEVEAFGILEIK